MRITKLKLIVMITIGISISLAKSNFLHKFLGLDDSIISPPPTTISATGTITVAFSPKNGITKKVVEAINQANKSILVSAYSFTSKDIASSLLNAKNRGINILIILDKSQASSQYSSSRFFANNGFNVKIDNKHAIFHDKIMIVDNKTVITGSFNFTKAAETKNAENILIIKENPSLAKLYIQDWQSHWQHSIKQDEFEMLIKDKKSAKSKSDELEKE